MTPFSSAWNPQFTQLPMWLRPDDQSGIADLDELADRIFLHPAHAISVLDDPIPLSDSHIYRHTIQATLINPALLWPLDRAAIQLARWRDSA